jgi:phosphohistidine phosphatase SixA
VLSSPAVRCVQTIVPLAVNRGLAVERRQELAEGTPVAGMLDLLAAAEPWALLCTHGDLLLDLLGTEVPEAGTAVIEVGPGDLRVLETVPTPLWE